MSINGGRRDLIESDDPFPKTRKQISKKNRREKKKIMGKQARICRRLLARGISISDEDDEDDHDLDDDADESDNVNEESYYFKPCPLNVCNICREIFDSVKGKLLHLKDSSKHDGKKYEFPCKDQNCGCYYSTDTDCRIHYDLHHRNYRS